MNEQTQKLIEELAAKLGVTAEHLWAVLVRQAPISAACDAFVITAVIAIGTFLTRLGVRKISHDEGDAWPVAVFAGGILLVFGIGGIMCCTSDIIAGLLNPEYWALKQIIKWNTSSLTLSSSQSAWP